MLPRFPLSGKNPIAQQRAPDILSMRADLEIARLRREQGPRILRITRHDQLVIQRGGREGVDMISQLVELLDEPLRGAALLIRLGDFRQRSQPQEASGLEGRKAGATSPGGFGGVASPRVYIRPDLTEESQQESKSESCSWREHREHNMGECDEMERRRL